VIRGAPFLFSKRKSPVLALPGPGSLLQGAGSHLTLSRRSLGLMLVLISGRRLAKKADPQRAGRRCRAFPKTNGFRTSK